MTVTGVSSGRASEGLRIIAEVAQTLTFGLPSQDALATIAGALTRRFRARACRIWVREPTGESYTAVVPAGDTAPPPVAAAVAEAWSPRERSAGDGTALTLRVPLLSHGDRLGLLETTVVEPDLQMLAEDVTPVVANILAPLLATLELSEDLASELALGARELEAQRQFTAKIIDSLPVGLYVIDRSYHVQAWNRKRETGTQGISREKAIGRSIFEILHRQPRELLRTEFDEVFTSGRIQQVEIESTAIGEKRHYRITKIPMRLHGDEVTHVITIGEDITESREALAQIAQTEKLAAVGQLAAGVMHEINNPLATISACTEALALRADSVPTPERSGFTEYLHTIEVEVRRCKRIVNELLDFSRPKPRAKHRTEINDVVDQTLFLLKHHERFRRLKVRADLAPALPPIMANAEQLVQVFMALMLNAMDAMEGAEREATLAVRTMMNPDRDDEVVVSLTDTGVGIPRSQLANIFEPFFTTKPQGRGTGLGLSICYGLIAEHRGRIEAESELGRGSTFRVFLPVTSP